MNFELLCPRRDVVKNKGNIGEKITIGRSGKGLCPTYCKNHYHEHLQ
jgi:hypothetical protein